MRSAGDREPAGLRPVLVIALGNPLGGDDGIAARILQCLKSRELAQSVELLEAGPDLLRLETELHGRERIVLIDALLDDGPPGRLLRFDDDFSELDDSGESVHQLSPMLAFHLLRLLHPDLRATPATLLGITIPRVRVRARLSREVETRLSALVDSIVREIGESH